MASKQRVYQSVLSRSQPKTSSSQSSLQRRSVFSRKEEEQLEVAKPPENAPSMMDNVMRSPEARKQPAIPPREFIQPKLKIGAVGDKCEQEADRMAKTVVQRINAPQASELPHPGGIQQKTILRDRREEIREDNETVQRKIDAFQQIWRKDMQVSASNEEIASQEFEQKLSHAKGGGQPLNPKVQAKMEAGFETDFSGVKVHTDEQSDRLNESIQAKAFTTGTNIFFKQGEYKPESREGQELIAHELTHVVQQNGHSIQRMEANKSDQECVPIAGKIKEKGKNNIQRLTLQNTNWDAANSGYVTTGSGKGVAIISDGKTPVVVKAGEELGDEVIVAGNLIGAILKQGEKGKRKKDGETTEARVLDDNEVKSVYKIIDDFMDVQYNEDEVDNKTKKEKQEKSRKKDNFLKDLKKGEPSIVFSFTSGKDFKDYLNQKDESKKTKLTKKNWRGKRKLRNTGVKSMIKNKTPMKTLGKIAAVDLFTGNGDRVFVMMNTTNFQYDEKENIIKFIDNVQSHPRSYLYDRDKVYNRKQGYIVWSQMSYLSQFIEEEEDDNDSLTSHVKQQLKGVGQYDIKGLRVEDDNIVKTEWLRGVDSMTSWFMQGLYEGRKDLLKVLANGIDPLLQGTRDDKKAELIEGIGIRYLCLKQGKILDYDEALAMLRSDNEALAILNSNRE